jgi:glycosyltransferase involved in cell wall biosynthesis
LSRVAGRVGALFDQSLKMIGDQWRLAWEVMKRRPDAVLLASYSEYLSPFWIWPHWILSKCFGVVYVANLHDPVRDYVLGPKWWHDLSVKMAYWPISIGVVHQRLPEPSPVPGHVRVVETPVGVYDLQESPENPEKIREGWGVGRRVAPEDRRSEIGDRGEEGGRQRSEDGDQKADGPAADDGGLMANGGGAGKFQPLIALIDTDNDAEAGLRPGSRAGAPESDSLASKLADSPVPESPIRFADGPASSLDSGRSPLDSAPALDAGRSSLDSSAPADVVFLAFGFIRDNKNLDLVIRALAGNPRAFLVVMGRAQSRKDKPVEFYRSLAEELGVAERVRFFNEFVPDEKLASYFAAADVVVLTYDKTFHSQSGVLNVAARARRPVLASAGESPLKDCVERFNLGVFVEPDDLVALERGMEMVASGEWRVAGGEPDWEGYERFASWDVNVSKILEAVEKVKN